jgi:hypothetical protein
MPPPQQPLQTSEICNRLLELVDEGLPAPDLLARLQAMAEDWRVRRMLWRVGPTLYARDAASFRTFLLTNLDTCCTDERGGPAHPWKAPHRDTMEQWLAQAGSSHDVEMFCMLYAWRARTWTRAKRERHWRADLGSELAQAETPEATSLVLENLQGCFVLDEPTAVMLYRHDPVVAAGFVARHLPSSDGSATGYWAELSALARDQGDEDLFFAVYRATVEDDQWARDVDALAERLDDGVLQGELQRRRPARGRGNVSSVLFNLLRRRGEAALPFAISTLQSLPGLPDADVGRVQDLVRLADEREWLELWGALLRGAGRQKDFDREVRRLVEERRRDEQAVVRRLRVLAGVGWAPSIRTGGMNLVHPLSADTAVRLHARFPALVRGPFRAHVAGGMCGGDLRLIEAAIAAKDSMLVDILASRLVLEDLGSEAARRQFGLASDLLAKHYANLSEDPCALPLRCARILGQLRTGLVRNLDRLIATNPLARLLWLQPAASVLACPDAVRDLLECAEPHAQLIAFRALASEHTSAGKLGRANLDMLRAALLAPMPRRVRLVAFAAVKRAAETQRASRQLVDAMREALHVSSPRYPREDLLLVLGALLARWPALRQCPGSSQVSREAT